MVVIINADQVAQLKMASRRGSFTCNTLHGAAIAKETVCVVVDQIISGFVEDSTSVCLCDCQTDCVGKALAERTSRDLNAGGIMSFRVTGSDAVNLLLGVSAGSEHEECENIL